jgi:hypothetical protein
VGGDVLQKTKEHPYGCVCLFFGKVQPSCRFGRNFFCRMLKLMLAVDLSIPQSNYMGLVASRMKSFSPNRAKASAKAVLDRGGPTDQMERQQSLSL